MRASRAGGDSFALWDQPSSVRPHAAAPADTTRAADTVR